MEVQTVLQAARLHDSGAYPEAVAVYLEVLGRGGPPWVGQLAALAFQAIGASKKASQYLARACEQCPEVGLLHQGQEDSGVNIQSYLAMGGESCASATALHHAAVNLIDGGDLVQGYGMLSVAHSMAPGITRIKERLYQMNASQEAGVLDSLARLEIGIMAQYAESSPSAQAFSCLKREANRDAVARARVVLAKPVIRILLLIYDETRDLLPLCFEPQRFQVTQVPDVETAAELLDGGEYDFFLTTNIYMEREENLARFLSARKNPEAVHAVWLTDLHHSHRQSLRLARVFDFAIPAHERNTDGLRLVSETITSSVHMAVQQFSHGQARRLYDAAEFAPRRDGLYGGFRQHPGFSRNEFIHRLGEAIPGNALYIRPNTTPYEDDAYFCLSDDDKFLNWMSYKVTLHVPIHRDLSPRVFDALLAGQIPLVPMDIGALDHYFPLADQARLPLVKYEEYTPRAVSEAYARALAMWDEGGHEGARRRHEYSLQRGMLAYRLRRMVDAVALFAGCHAQGYLPRSES